MKKMTLLALCIASVGTMSAQKSAVDQAKSLSGKFDKLEEARALIKQAAENPETANQANTYFIGGKIEYDAYDKGLQASMINPEDPSANPVAMGQELLNGYQWFLKALPLDSLPNEKGQIKPKYSKDIVSKITGHANDYLKAGAALYEAKQYYPAAYDAFMIFADMPDQAFLGNKAPKIDPADRGLAYFNAGLAAYSGNEPVKSADAFSAARAQGYDDVNAYIYEIACWQSLAQRDSTMADTAKDRIFIVAKDGNAKFGMEQPIFLNNMVNSMVLDGKTDDALAIVNEAIGNNPENADLYGLRAFVYDRADNNDASVADYKKAASMPGVGFETLKNAAKKVFRVGTDKLASLDMADRDGRMALKAEYFEPSSKIAEQANAMQGGDSDLLYVIDSINYALENYFK